MRPWERKKNESEVAFESFRFYLDLGLSRRVADVGRHFHKSGTQLSRWSVRHDWKERARLWDNEQEQTRIDAERKAITRAAEQRVYKQELSKERILNEAANLAFSRITDVMHWSGIEGLIDSKLLPDHVAAAVESIQIEREPETGAITKHRIKFHSKIAPLDRLGQHKKLWGAKEDPTIEQNNNFLVVIQALIDAKTDLLQDDDDRKRGRGK